ncbi:hypothetical protein BT93_C1180 [Corymbia citriodora subsp. variegata]|nr:hypothetical protein BT93_C1180 [Corymbia citriodora subsp. variegata]
MGERDGNAWVCAIISLFFVCVLAGGVFLSIYLLLPAMQSNRWLYLAGLVLEAIPWCFWLLGYLYYCLRRRPANNPPKGFPARVHSTAVAPEPAPANYPESPAKDSPHSRDNDDDEKRHVHFGAVVVMGKEEQNGHQSGVEGRNNNDNALGNGERGGDHSLSNTGSTSSTLNDHDLSITSRESEMPLTHGVSSCK